MNFLETIWLIPLFPLLGAALMLIFGKILDPQPMSAVAVAPGVEPIFEHGHDHGHSHSHDHGHTPRSRPHARSRPRLTITAMTTATITIITRPSNSSST